MAAFSRNIKDKTILYLILPAMATLASITHLYENYSPSKIALAGGFQSELIFQSAAESVAVKKHTTRFGGIRNQYSFDLDNDGLEDKLIQCGNGAIFWKSGTHKKEGLVEYERIFPIHYDRLIADDWESIYNSEKNKELASKLKEKLKIEPE
ncbi:MAG: hypothetical protein Q7K43_00630 [Candidatus Woesearchaeota archaeon]|nr:hypothetical protein [Candidatus Woesearchaeota archaeon]